MILDPIVTVECDNCQAQEEFQMTPLAGGCYDNRGIREKALDSGWIISGKNHFCCEDCFDVNP